MGMRLQIGWSVGRSRAHGCMVWRYFIGLFQYQDCFHQTPFLVRGWDLGMRLGFALGYIQDQLLVITSVVLISKGQPISDLYNKIQSRSQTKIFRADRVTLLPPWLPHPKH